MRWTIIKRGEPPWRKWFAWRPVRIGDERVWWETVERQDYVACGEPFTNYRFPPAEPYGPSQYVRDFCV